MNAVLSMALTTILIYHGYWLATGATIWSYIKPLARGEITITQFIEAGADCPVCRGHWLTAPMIYTSIYLWSSVNVAHILISRFLPYTEEDPEPAHNIEGPYPAPEDTDGMAD